MKLLLVVSFLLVAVTSALGQLISLGYPTNGAVLHRGQSFNAQIIKPFHIQSCIQVGIALAVSSCDSGVCPQPAERLGYVLYAGPWNATIPTQGGSYQNFTVQISEYMKTGPATFTLTHFCLLGGGPTPFLEYRNASVTIE